MAESKFLHLVMDVTNPCLHNEFNLEYCST